jgi:hypothetical protein
MSSKAEKTSNRSHQQPRLNIFFRSPLLLKIVAWLGSLSFLSSTGLVWADLKPISTSETYGPEFIPASVPPVADNVSAPTFPSLKSHLQFKLVRLNCQIGKYRLPLLPLMP